MPIHELIPRGHPILEPPPCTLQRAEAVSPIGLTGYIRSTDLLVSMLSQMGDSASQAALAFDAAALGFKDWSATLKLVPLGWHRSPTARYMRRMARRKPRHKRRSRY